MSRAIIKKYVYLNQQERDNSKILKKKIQNLENKVSSISTNTSFINNNKNNQQVNLLTDIFQDYNLNNIENSNISLSSDDSDDDKNNIDLSFIKNKSLKDNKRTKTCEKINKVPKLDFKSVIQNYKNPPNIKVIRDK